MTSVLLSAGLKTVQQIKRNDLRKILAKEINCRDERFKITEKKINFKKNNVN